MDTRVWVTASQKGGAGKTTAAMCLGDGLARRGHHVLIIDADPQATAYKWESRPNQGFPRYPVRVEKLCGLSPVDFLKSVLERCRAEREQTGKEFDYVLIDTPPNLKSSDLEAALFVADLVVVPAKPNGMYIDALEELFALFAAINERRKSAQRPPLDVRMLINFMHTNRRTNLNLVTVLRKALERWAEVRHVQARMLEGQFKYLAAFENAPNFRTSVYHLPGSKDARDSIDAVVEELI
ncbi:Chromosome-partitioning ATPase Soj [compost metagenome]